MARRITLLMVSAVAALALVAGPASAAHEANNRFDMAATTAELPTADATGLSNYSAGNDGWNNQVRASGLAPSTTYTWVGIAMGTASEICSFTTDEAGTGSCRSDVNSRLGATEIRLGDVAGPTVLRATASTDDDNTVDDGEIERRGTQRDAE